MNEERRIPAMERVSVDSERYFEHDLQFYDEPLTGFVDLADLEKLVIDRMKILRMVKEVAETTKNWAKGRRILTAKLRKAGFQSFADLCNGKGYQESHSPERYSTRRKDHVSHCILLLCMAQKSETGNWFRQAEVTLFKLRLSALDSAGIDVLLFVNNLNYPTLTEDKKKLLSKHLKRAMKHPSKFESTTFYEVPAIEILNSIKNSHIYLKDGVAYATFHQLRPAILLNYETRLKSRIANMRGAPNYMIDPRVHRIMGMVEKFFGHLKPPVWDQGVTTVDTLDATATRSYPPCMRKIHEGLRKVHHLRNLGRVQYTLFLKAIGVKPEDALAFYREEFTKEIDDTAFDKEYVYIFLHLYGLKGRKISHDVPNCAKMAEVKSRRNEYHGCPMATEDIEDLGKMLESWNINGLSRRKIIRLVEINEPTNACAEYFTAIHGDVEVHPIKNPKDFYGQSIKPLGCQNCPSIVPAKSEAVAGEILPVSTEFENSDTDEDFVSDGNNPTLEGTAIKKLTISEKTALMKKKVLEFYKNSERRKNENLPKSVPATSKIDDEPSYLDYISNYFEELEITTIN